MYNIIRSLLVWLPCMALAQLDPAFISASREKINAARTREANINVFRGDSSAEGLSIRVKQLRHHFGFGAAIGYDYVLNVPGYAENFLKFFEWAVFENDMKWPSTDPTPNGPDYSKVDSLIQFCLKNDIKVRGHNLFWNQMEDWFPTWTLDLSPDDFKAAVDARIQNAMSHFKGKVEHWDIVNEIIHGSVLQDHSGDPEIINYIFNQAHAIDSSAKLTVNDFNILVWNDTEDYISNINSMLSKGTPIDIVGCEGHFGDQLSQDYASKLDRVASLNLPIWITELDFSSPGNPADDFEKLMRTFYGHPSVEGVVMWVWWEGNKWREELNSSVVNEDFTTTALGERYLQLMEEWTTQDSGLTDENGGFHFKGHHGKYEVSVFDGDTSFFDTLYLQPGAGSDQWNLEFPEKQIPISVKHSPDAERNIFINETPVKYPGGAGLSPKLEVFNTKGELVWNQEVGPNTSHIDISHLPRGCYVYRLILNGHLYFDKIGFKIK